MRSAAAARSTTPKGPRMNDNPSTANPPLPVALRNEEISQEDFEALCRIAENPEAMAGRLQRVPRKIPLGDRVPKSAEPVLE